MAKGTGISKALAIGIGVITVTSVCGLVLMSALFFAEIEKNPPTAPPTPTTTTVVPTEPPSTLRLFDYLIPESYNIFLQPYLYPAIPNNYTEQNFFFTGNSTVRFKCMNISKVIFLHVHSLNVTSVEVTKSFSNEKISVSGYKIHYNESNFLEIQLKDKLSGNGTYYDLFTAFEGELFDDMAGFYVSQYSVNGIDEEEDEDTERFLATSLLQPTDARTVFPCFDEPAMKATFTVTIIHRPGSHALSNTGGKKETIQIDGEEWTMTKFETTPIMSSYLLAFTVSDFSSKGIDFRIKMAVHARKEAIDDGHADYALEITRKILQHYENIFGLRYPLAKLDQIAVPDFRMGAMENWGAISYQESGLLYDKNTASTFDKEWVATLIAHELAHQWFGNLVTMRWWNDLWLNEGFATYMSYIGVEAADWDLKDLIVLREIQTAFQVDCLNSSRPLSLHENDVQTYSEIIEHFDDVTYSKGAAVLRMLARYITEDVFMKGIKTYLSKFQYKNTVSKDLWECLQAETALKVKDFMTTWIEQAGYPVITIITQTGHISQEQFLLKQMAGHDVTWKVPIIYIKSTQMGPKDDLLDKDTAQWPHFKVNKDEWLLTNINCTGFYRVNYDEENWNKLLLQLDRNHHVIPLINRGQLIDDAFNLARAHRLNVTIALSLTKYLINETKYIPWESALKNLNHFILMFDRSEVYGPITKYLRKQVKPLYEHFEEYTLNGTIPENHTDQYNQVNAISVACSNGLQECMTMATGLLKKYRNGTNLIHPNLRTEIYCSAVAAGDEDDWEFVWEEYQKATVAAEKDKLRHALSCTKEIWLLNRFLQYTIDPTKIRKMDMVSTISHIAQNVAGQPLAWDFIRGQWSHISQEYGITSLGALIDTVTKRFSEEVELEKLKQLQREHTEDDQGLISRVLEKVIERTEANIKWVEENKKIVREWFSAEL